MTSSLDGHYIYHFSPQRASQNDPQSLLEPRLYHLTPKHARTYTVSPDKMNRRQRFLKALEVAPEGRHGALDNPDLRPIPVEERQWGVVTYGTFWMGAISAAGAWIATPLTSGLGVWPSVFAMFAGMILSGIGLAFNGRAGAVYHIPYPVICRSCFGIYGAYWPMFCRVLVTLAFAATGMATAAQLIRFV